MNAGDHLGPGEHEQIVVAFQIARMITEALAAEVRFRQLVALNHRAHRAVEDEDAVREQIVEHCTNITFHK